jgi:hypothetical protein
MKPYIALALLAFAACPFARSQAAPAATTRNADLKYALRYSETAESTDTLRTWHTIDTSGSLDYANGRARRPFSLEYSGGYTSTLSGPSYATGAYHRMTLSQGFDWRKGFLTLTDDVGYRPQAPTTGFSGIPGTGEPIGTGPNPPPTQLILTVNTHVLNNDASGQIQHTLAYRSTFSVEVHHDLLRFPDGNGLDTDQFMIGAGPTFRMDARNSLVAHYSFSRFSYSDYNTRFHTDTIEVGYNRVWSRAFRSSVSVGPEWVAQATSVPGSTGVSAQASLAYQARQFSASVAYSRATSGGSGYLMGAEGDSTTGSFTRSLTKTFVLEMSGGYRHTTDLAKNDDIAGEFGSVQASWRFGQYLNAFANYTATSQSSSGTVPSNVLNQLLQSVSFGIGFSKDIRAAR